MKKLIIVLVITVFTLKVNAQDTKINWMTFEEAVAAQANEPRKIMVDMYTTWCGPCRMLDKNTFQQKDLVKYVNENYYAVKFNAEGDGDVSFKEQKFSNPNYDPAKKRGRNSQHELASAFGVNAYPTILFLDESANLLAPVRGYQNHNQLELFLKVFGSDAHKNISSKEDFIEYQKNFKPQFGVKQPAQLLAKVEKKESAPITVSKKVVKLTPKKEITKKLDPNVVKTHTVVVGETLGKIASAYYKNAGQYVLIFKANKDILKSPNNIYVGQVLKIPEINNQG